MPRFILVLLLACGEILGQSQAASQGEQAVLSQARQLLADLHAMTAEQRASFFRDPQYVNRRELLSNLINAYQALTSSSGEWKDLHEALDYMIEWWTATNGPDDSRTNMYRFLQSTMYQVHESDYCHALIYGQAALESYRRIGNDLGIFQSLVGIAGDADACGRDAIAEQALSEAKARISPASSLGMIQKIYELLAKRLPAKDRAPLVRALGNELESIAGSRTSDSEKLQLQFAAALLETSGHRMDGRFDEAFHALSLAQSIADKVPPEKESSGMVRLQVINEAMALIVQASVDMNYEEAMRIVHRIGEELWREGDLVDVRAFAAQTEEIRMRAAGKYEDILRKYQAQADAAEKARDAVGETEALWQMGLIYRALNESDHANDFFGRALKLAQVATEDALKDFQTSKIVPVYLDLTLLPIRADMWMADGQMDRTQEDLDAAKSVLARIPGGMREMFFTREADELQISLGKAAAERGDIAAVSSIADAIEKEKSAKGVLQPNLAYQLESFRARAYEKAGKIREAILHLSRAIDLAGQAKQRPEQMRLLRDLSKLYLDSGQLDGAMRAAGESLELARKFVAPDREWRAQFDLGKAYEKKSDPEQAIASYRAAIGTIEALRSGLSTAEYRAAVLENSEIEELYQRLIQLLLERDRSGEAFEVAERDKARTFLETLGTEATHAAVRTELGSPLLKEQVALRERIAVLDAELRRASSSSGDATRSAISPEMLEGRLVEAKKKYTGLIERMKLNAPREASLVSVAPVPLQSIQKKMGDSTALLEFYVVPRGVVLFQLTKDQFSSTLQPTTPEALHALIADFRSSMAKPGPDNIVLWKKSGNELRKVLIGQLNESVRQARHWMIVPHGLLHLVPLGALPLDAEGKEALVDRHDVRYLPNASVLQFAGPDAIEAHKSQKPLFVALGNLHIPPYNTLPATRQEVILASKQFPNATVLLEGAATKAKVLEISRDSDLIHFATHGIMDYENPLFSSLLFAPDPAGGLSSEQLTLSEVLEHPFGADVVTLSACQTALSHVGMNDELMNLARAFLLSGAHHVVASLWSVDDKSTALLMEHFYRAVARGVPLAEALCAAEAELRRSRPDPFLWAPFILVSSN